MSSYCHVKKCGTNQGRSSGKKVVEQMKVQMISGLQRELAQTLQYAVIAHCLGKFADFMVIKMNSQSVRRSVRMLAREGDKNFKWRERKGTRVEQESLMLTAPLAVLAYSWFFWSCFPINLLNNDDLRGNSNLSPNSGNYLLLKSLEPKANILFALLYREWLEWIVFSYLWVYIWKEHSAGQKWNQSFLAIGNKMSWIKCL